MVGRVIRYNKWQLKQHYQNLETLINGLLDKFSIKGHTHSIGTIDGAILTVNGAAPDANGNVTVTTSSSDDFYTKEEIDEFMESLINDETTY